MVVASTRESSIRSAGITSTRYAAAILKATYSLLPSSRRARRRPPRFRSFLSRHVYRHSAVVRTWRYYDAISTAGSSSVSVGPGPRPRSRLRFEAGSMQQLFHRFEEGLIASKAFSE